RRNWRGKAATIGCCTAATQKGAGAAPFFILLEKQWISRAYHSRTALASAQVPNSNKKFLLRNCSRLYIRPVKPCGCDVRDRARGDLPRWGSWVKQSTEFLTWVPSNEPIA